MYLCRVFLFAFSLTFLKNTMIEGNIQKCRLILQNVVSLSSHLKKWDDMPLPLSHIGLSLIIFLFVVFTFQMRRHASPLEPQGFSIFKTSKIAKFQTKKDILVLYSLSHTISSSLYICPPFFL